MGTSSVPQFLPSLGMEWEIRRKTVHRNPKNKQGIQQTIFLSSFGSEGGISSPVWDLPHFSLYCCSYSSLNQEPCQNKILWILCTDTQFYETGPNFTHSSWAMRQGLEFQTTGQGQDLTFQGIAHLVQFATTHCETHKSGIFLHGDWQTEAEEMLQSLDVKCCEVL
jgi:hypothetical protein